MAKDKTVKKSKIRTAIKWFRRISFVAAVVGAVRKYQMEKNETQPPKP